VVGGVIFRSLMLVWLENPPHEYDLVFVALYYVLLDLVEDVDVYFFLCFIVKLRHVCRYSYDGCAIMRGDFGCFDVVCEVCWRLYGGDFLVYVPSCSQYGAG